MQLTRAADYAVRVMLHLATLPRGVRASRAQLAKAAEAPPSFVAKILQQLVGAHLVRSHAGRSGGFELALPPAQVSLLDVVTAMEGPVCLNHCLPPIKDCQRSSWCPAHPIWAEAQAALQRVLADASLDRLLAANAARSLGPVIGIPNVAAGNVGFVA